MIGIAWRTVRRQTGTLLGAFVMSAVGAVLITAFVVIQSSLAQTRAPVERFAGAAVVVSGDPGMISPMLLQQVGQVPGVERAVPELTFPALMLDRDGQPLWDLRQTAQFGHSWSSARMTPFEIVDGQEPTGTGQVALDATTARVAGARVGDQVPVEVGGVVRRMRVSGIVEAGHGALTFQRTLFFSPQEAVELAGRGSDRSDAAGIILTAGADPAVVGPAVQDRVRAALAGDVSSPSGVPSFQVTWGTGRGESEGSMPGHRASAQAMNMLVWIVAFMAVAVVGGAFTMSVRRRAAQVALLRAVGATPRQVRLLCQAEALAVSTAAVLVGAVAGPLLAWGLMTFFRAWGVVSPVATVRPSGGSVLAAAVAVVLVGQAAAWFASRSALRVRPGDILTCRAEPVAPAQRARLRTACGVLVLVAAGGVQAAGMAGAVPEALRGSYGMIASGLVIVGIAGVGSTLIHLLAGWCRRPVSRWAPVGGFLAAANVRHHHRRYAGVAAPLSIGVAIAGWSLSGLPLFALANGQQVAERFAASYVVSTPIVRDRHTGLSEDARTAVGKLPGVAAAVGVREAWLHAGGSSDQQISRSGVTRATVVSGAASQVLQLGAVQGDLAKVDAGEGIALGIGHAARQGLGLGSEAHVRITGASAPTRLPVVALFEKESGGKEAAVVSQKALGERAGAPWFDYVLLAARGDTPVSTEAVRSVVTGGNARVERQEHFLDSYVAERRGAIDNMGTVATVLVGFFLVVAAVNALALSAADRRDELLALRRLNAGPGQVRAMVAWEMLLTVVPAWALGMAATGWMAVAMAGGDLGAAWWAFPVAVLSSMGALAVLLAVGGALATTRVSVVR